MAYLDDFNSNEPSIGRIVYAFYTILGIYWCICGWYGRLLRKTSRSRQEATEHLMDILEEEKEEINSQLIADAVKG